MRPEPIKDGPETKNAGAKNAFWKKKRSRMKTSNKKGEIQKHYQTATFPFQK